MADAMPFKRFAPDSFCIIVLPFFSRPVRIRLAVVVFPLVPPTIIVFVSEFLRISAIKFAFPFKAICPGHVDPLPRFKDLLIFETVLPRLMRAEFIISLILSFMAEWSLSKIYYDFVHFFHAQF